MNLGYNGIRIQGFYLNKQGKNYLFIKLASKLNKKLQLIILVAYNSNQTNISNMNWSQPRKKYQSSLKSAKQKVSNTCLNTPPRHLQDNDHSQGSPSVKQCPYHFGQPSHICLTCRRSICLRCAITYCQQHTIHPQQQILPLLMIDLQKLTIQPRIEDIELRLRQSQQRQQYLIKKMAKILSQVQQNFQHIRTMLEKKKQQIMQYYKEQLQGRFIIQYQKYDQQLIDKLNWLKDALETSPKCTAIEELDQLAALIKKQIPSSEALSKAQLKISKLIAGKDKVKTNNIWSQQRLQQVLYQIQNIEYKIKSGNNLTTSFTSSNKKKRVSTEISDSQKHQRLDKSERNIQFNSNTKNPFAGMMNSGSNSRFSSGRKVQH